MEYVEIFYDECLKETDEAILLSFDSDEPFNMYTKWIPKSCIEDESLVDYNSEMYIGIERWFAEKEELI